MKQYLILLLICCQAAFGWGFDQRFCLEQQTTQTLQSLGETLERSSNKLSNAINLVTEKGISSLPLNIDADVWHQLRHLIIMLALVTLSWVMIYGGLRGWRDQDTRSCCYACVGILLMIFSNVLAKVIVGIL